MTATAHALRIRTRMGHCNELLELQLGGRTLVVKRALFDWGAPRLRASRIAAALLRRRTGILAPHHLPIEESPTGAAVEAYWRIELPTLLELWQTMRPSRRSQALRSWGTLLRRVHGVKLTGHGDLEGAVRGSATLTDFLRGELADRLIPALSGVWPTAVRWAHRLMDLIDPIAHRCHRTPVVLLHNDFHMGNVLCQERPRSLRCVGVIDLETASAGPPESDIARVQVLHGSAFGKPLPKDWCLPFLEGYGAEPDNGVLAFFRAFHRLNLGYFAALSGWHAHVSDLEAGIERDLLIRLCPRSGSLLSCPLQPRSGGPEQRRGELQRPRTRGMHE